MLLFHSIILSLFPEVVCSKTWCVVGGSIQDVKLVGGEGGGKERTVAHCCFEAQITRGVCDGERGIFVFIVS